MSMGVVVIVSSFLWMAVCGIVICGSAIYIRLSEVFTAAEIGGSISTVCAR